MEDDEAQQDADALAWANEDLAERQWLYRNFGIDK